MLKKDQIGMIKLNIKQIRQISLLCAMDSNSVDLINDS